MVYNKELYDFQEKVVKDTDNLMKSAGLSSFELKEVIQETIDKYPDWKEDGDKFSNYWKTIRNYDSFEQVNNFFEKMGKVIALAQQRKIEKLKEQVKEKEERDRKLAENIKQIFNKSKNEKPAETPSTNSSFDEETKKKYIEETERDLKKHNISEQKLNEKLGVSDWRSEMNKSLSWSSAQTFRFSIQDIIKKIEREIVCDYCKETKSPIIDYDIPSKKKKFCSTDCQFAWEGENKGKDEKPSKNNNYSTSRENNFGFTNVSEFFAWMKKLGVEKIEFDFNTSQVIISCKGNKKLNVYDSHSGLTTKQQQALTERFKSETEPITFSQVQDKLEKGTKDKGGNVGIIAAIVVVGIIFIGIISLVIYKTRKKDY